VKEINNQTTTISHWNKNTLVGKTSLVSDPNTGNTTFGISGQSGNNAIKFGKSIVVTGKPEHAGSTTSELLVTDTYENSGTTVKLCVQDYNNDSTRGDLRKICLGDDKLDFTRKVNNSIEASTIGYRDNTFTLSSTLNGSPKPVNLQIEGNLTVTGSVTTPGDDGLFESATTHIYTANVSKSVVIGASTLISTSNKLEVNGNARISDTLSAEVVLAFSDRNLKTNIKNIENSIDKIKKINGVSFNWKRNGEGSYGVIAQDVEKILPDAVNIDTGYRSVNYNSVVALLVETCKMQEIRIKKLEEKVNNLESKM